MKNILNLDNFVIDNNVKVSNDSLINIILIEATFEDYILIVRKAFEKGVLNFNETIKFMKVITREAFKIKYYREKLIECP